MPILAYDIGGTRVKAALVVSGHLSGPVARAETARDGGPEQLFGQIVSLGRTVRGSAHLDAAGISIRGVVDAEAGVVLALNPPLDWLVGEPMADRVANELGVPVVIENDARMYALGELQQGAARGVANFVCLTLGTGVGCGVVVGRRLLQGPRGVGGILAGHLTVDVDGPLCTCGNLGCLEALINAQALTASVEAQLRAGQVSSLRLEGLSPPYIFEAAGAGDALAVQALSRFTHVLGCGVVNVIHAYDPDLVVIGGGLSGSSSYFLPELRAYVAEHAWTQPKGRVRIVVSELGDAAALVGVAALATDKAFVAPAATGGRRCHDS